MPELSQEPARHRALPAGWRIGLVVGVLMLPAAVLTDRQVVALLRPDGAPWLLDILQAVTWLGYGLVDIAVPVAIGLAARGFGDTNMLRRGCLGGAVVAFAGILDQVVKNVVCRARPSAAVPGAFFAVFPCFPAPYALASFPSGHATTAFALATLLTLWYPKWTAAWLGLATLVGWSRIALGPHFPSDVLAGGLLGVAVVLLWVRWVPGTCKCKMQN